MPEWRDTPHGATWWGWGGVSIFITKPWATSMCCTDPLHTHPHKAHTIIFLWWRLKWIKSRTLTNASLDVITEGLAWGPAVLTGQASGLTHPGGNIQEWWGFGRDVRWQGQVTNFGPPKPFRLKQIFFFFCYFGRTFSVSKMSVHHYSSNLGVRFPKASLDNYTCKFHHY